MEVRLFATFRDGRGKVLQINHYDGMDGHALIKELAITKEEVAIFLVNGHHKKLDFVLNEEDIIALFPPVGGG